MSARKHDAAKHAFSVVQVSALTVAPAAEGTVTGLREVLEAASVQGLARQHLTEESVNLGAVDVLEIRCSNWEA